MNFHLIKKTVFMIIILVEKSLILKHKNYKENNLPHQNNKWYIKRIINHKFNKV